MDHVLAALEASFQWQNLVAIAIGNLFGLIVGAMPGLTITVGIIFILPATFFLSPTVAMSLLLGVYCSGMTGGSVSAILLRIPGTPSASATVFDGHPMAQRGEAGRALAMAVFSSFCGGIVSFLAFAFLSPMIAKVALKFGAPELFALVLLGLTLIVSFGRGSAESLIKAGIAGAVGIILSTVGFDIQTGTARYTFGITDLQVGLHVLVVMIGLFALPQLFQGVKEWARGHWTAGDSPQRLGIILPSREDVKYSLPAIGVGSFLGTAIGAVPGAGGPIAVFLAYEYAKRISARGKLFGTGVPEGIAAPESANNAITGGALIPALTLGIPGDAITAVMLAALMLQGLIPGPLLFQQQPVFVYSLFVSLLLANVLNLILVLICIPLLVRVLQVSGYYLLPIIAVSCVVGAYSLRNNIVDIVLMVLFGLLGYLMNRYDIPSIPLLLGVILGRPLEQHLQMSLILSDGSVSIFFQKPVALLFILGAILFLVMPLVQGRRSKATVPMPGASG